MKDVIILIQYEKIQEQKRTIEELQKQLKQTKN